MIKQVLLLKQITIELDNKHYITNNPMTNTLKLKLGESEYWQLENMNIEKAKEIHYLFGEYINMLTNDKNNETENN